MYNEKVKEKGKGREVESNTQKERQRERNGFSINIFQGLNKTFFLKIIKPDLSFV